jgi:CheY-like chemotaxis protein
MRSHLCLTYVIVVEQVTIQLPYGGHAASMNDEKTSRAPDARRVLVVEDEYFLADDLVSVLRDTGLEVVGPVGTLDAAERLVAEERIDCAILDINLRGQMAFPVADRLGEAGIPFIFATGYSRAAVPERFRDVPHIEKPFEPARLLRALLTGRD